MLSNPRADRVRAVHGLTRRTARDKSGDFLVEGPQAVREAIRHRPGDVRHLYASAGASQRHPELVAAAEDAGISVTAVTDEVLAAMADAGTPQGLVAVCRQRAATLADVLSEEPRRLCVLTNVRDPGNAGTVIRAASAFGSDAVVVSRASVDVWSPKVVRASVGTMFHLPVVTAVEVGAALAALRDNGIRCLAADGSGMLMLPDVDLSGPHAWVFGNEAWGMDADTLAACDEVVRVPMRDRVESLNLAMAATLCLYASAQAGS